MNQKNLTLTDCSDLFIVWLDYSWLESLLNICYLWTRAEVTSAPWNGSRTVNRWPLKSFQSTALFISQSKLNCCIWYSHRNIFKNYFNFSPISLLWIFRHFHSTIITVTEQSPPSSLTHKLNSQLHLFYSHP